MKKLLPIISLLTLLLANPLAVLGQSVTPSTAPSSSYVGNGTPTCISSSFGCIPTNPVELVGLILQIGIGIAGGIAFLMMVFGAIKLISSAGNPESVSQGKEFIKYALIGVIIVVFSVFLLTLIGVKILKIPGFG